MKKGELDLIEFVSRHMLMGIDTGEYRKEIHNIGVDLLWDAFHGYSSLGLELPDTTMFDYNIIPDDSHLMLLLGHAVYNTLFEFNHVRHCSTFCNEEPALNRAADAMYLDVRANWNPKSGTLDSYLKANWRLVVFFTENDQFGIPVKLAIPEVDE